MKWTTHRLREQPWRLGVALPCAVLAGAAGAHVLGSPLAGLIFAAAVCAAIGDYLFPVHFEINQEIACARCLLSRHEIRWESVRHIWMKPDGLKLSPLEHASRLEPFRGVFLRFGDNREEVLQTVRQHRAESARVLPSPGPRRAGSAAKGAGEELT